MIDIAVACNKYSFLGSEFLTWLWYSMENELGQLSDDGLELSMGRTKIVLENKTAKDDTQVITIKGEGADLKEGMIALKKGAFVTQMHILLGMKDMLWSLSLKNKSLSPVSMKLPTTETNDPAREDEFEGEVLEQVYLCEQISDVIDNLFKKFIKNRLSDEWTDTVLRIRKWILLSCDN